MAKRNGTTSQVMVYKILFIKVRTGTPLKHGDDRCSGKIGRSCSTGGPVMLQIDSYDRLATKLCGKK
jgi:hypothetical protein